MAKASASSCSLAGDLDFSTSSCSSSSSSSSDESSDSEGFWGVLRVSLGVSAREGLRCVTYCSASEEEEEFEIDGGNKKLFSSLV